MYLKEKLKLLQSELEHIHWQTLSINCNTKYKKETMLIKSAHKLSIKTWFLHIGNAS